MPVMANMSHNIHKLFPTSSRFFKRLFCLLYKPKGSCDEKENK